MEHNSRERIITSLICLLLLLGAGLGCKQLANRNLTRSGNNRNSNSGTASDGLTEKSNLYIKTCVNKYSNSVLGSYRRYASWLRDLDAGPTGHETNVYGLYEISGDGQDCLDAIKKAKSIEPKIPDVENAADAFGKALQDAVAQNNAIYPYYNHEDYKDDNFQKGKAAHPALLAAFKKFEQANKDFDGQVDKLEDDVARNRLNELKGDASKKYEYLVVDTSIKSKNIVKLVKATEFSQIKVEELQPMVDDLEKSINEMKTAAGNKPLSSLYISSCDDFLKAAKELMRRVRDKKPYSDFERRQVGTAAGWMVDGSPDKLINKYNEMIQRRGFGA